MKLYHYTNEDSVTKRICFSTTLYGALTALQENVNLLSGLINLAENYKCPAILHVYSFDIDETVDYFINNDLVRKTVPDAFLTNEVWITKSLDSKDLIHETVKLTNFKYRIMPINKEYAIFEIHDISFDYANKDDILANVNFWNDISSIYTKSTSKYLDISTKRKTISLFSKLDVKFTNK